MVARRTRVPQSVPECTRPRKRARWVASSHRRHSAMCVNDSLVRTSSVGTRDSGVADSPICPGRVRGPGQVHFGASRSQNVILNRTPSLRGRVPFGSPEAISAPVTPTPCPFCTLPPPRIIDSNTHGLVIRDGALVEHQRQQRLTGHVVRPLHF